MQIAVEQEGTSVTLRCTGRVDRAALPTLEERLDRVASAAPASLTIDLAEVPSICAAGFRLVMGAIARLHPRVRVVFADPSDGVSEVMGLLGFGRVADIVSTPSLTQEAA